MNFNLSSSYKLDITRSLSSLPYIYPKDKKLEISENEKILLKMKDNMLTARHVGNRIDNNGITQNVDMNNLGIERTILPVLTNNRSIGGLLNTTKNYKSQLLLPKD
jgi:hypothetical protein